MTVKNETGAYMLHGASTSFTVPYINAIRVGIVFERANGTKKMFTQTRGKSIYLESQIFYEHYRTGMSKETLRKYGDYLDYLTNKIAELNGAVEK